MSSDQCKVAFARQVSRDRAHHEMRIAWLESEALCWFDGTRVSEAERRDLLRNSRACLDAQSEMVGFNSCNCGDSCDESF